MKTDILKGHLLAIFTIIIWGTTFISTKVLLTGLNPVEILIIRFIIAFSALCIMKPKKLKLHKKSHEVYFFLAGLFGTCLYLIFEAIALRHTLASNASIIISTVPFFTAISSAIFLKDRNPFHINFILGFLIAMSGICIISFAGSNIKINPFGDALCLLAAASWSIYSVIIKKISTFDYNIALATRRIFFYGILCLIPFTAVFGFSPKISVLLRPEILFNLLFLGICASSICFITWNTALKILGPVKTSVYIYAQPVITVIFSFLVLKEPITAITITGMALTIIGLVLSEKRKNK